MSPSLTLFVLILKELTAQELETDLGPILGIDQNNYYEFRGIPFAQEPPTGSNRFKQSTVRTESYTNDSDVYDATYFRPACMQPPIDDEEVSEDWYDLSPFCYHCANMY